MKVLICVLLVIGATSAGVINGGGFLSGAYGPVPGLYSPGFGVGGHLIGSDPFTFGSVGPVLGQSASPVYGGDLNTINFLPEHAHGPELRNVHFIQPQHHLPLAEVKTLQILRQQPQPLLRTVKVLKQTPPPPPEVKHIKIVHQPPLPPPEVRYVRIIQDHPAPPPEVKTIQVIKQAPPPPQEIKTVQFVHQQPQVYPEFRTIQLVQEPAVQEFSSVNVLPEHPTHTEAIFNGGHHGSVKYLH